MLDVLRDFFPLAIRSYSAPIRSAVSLAIQNRGSTLLGALAVDVLRSGIYDLWTAVEAP
jgi:hypothetical protein